ncbi:DNA repair protein RecN [Rickettsia endosymbiont of Halotydeus destructor]|uniref:DNA repair protein RecN n=1 Tax=Rickettsia endosymbiont of Halotydeus destructor TaxID=2996754 RepID=UPI003BAE2D8A
MLESLSVKNFILIDELDIEFKKGLCVITGETGAGKSILLDAILFCLGCKSFSNIIKHGKDHAIVNLVFSLNKELKEFLEQANIQYEDALLVKCTQKSEGRKNFFINDQLVNKSTMQQLVVYLLEIHGQNNNTSLLDLSTHRDILDNYAELLEARLELAKCFHDWQDILKKIAKITLEKNAIDQEIDYLTFVVAELTKLDIKYGEEEKLINIRKDLQNRDKELQLLKDIFEQINNPEINNAINKAERLLTRSTMQSEKFTAIAADIEEAYNNLEEAREKLSSIADNFNQNEYNLDDIEERLFLIKATARKYNIHADEIVEFLNKSLEKLSILKNKVASSEELNTKQFAKQAEYYNMAKNISARRQEAAESLEKAVQKELGQLKMKKAIFKIDIVPKGEPAATGCDNISFTASTNPGMALAPINRIASGGELSRFMLALKNSLFDKQIKPTIIFDEIDVGIGGEVADKVGERLKNLGSIAQVIVITHQPQIAGKADQHIMVNKLQLEERTEVTVKILDIIERQQELARMISGQSITEASLKAAKELLT